VAFWDRLTIIPVATVYILYETTEIRHQEIFRNYWIPLRTCITTKSQSTGM